MSDSELKRSKLNSQLKNHYNITIEDFEDLQCLQGDKCAICGGDPPVSNKRRLSVDHCHETGRVRGLLCTRCNCMLGWFEKYTDEIQEYL